MLIKYEDHFIKADAQDYLRGLRTNMYNWVTLLIPYRSGLVKIYGLVQDRSVSSGIALEILQSCTKPLIKMPSSTFAGVMGKASQHVLG